MQHVCHRDACVVGVRDVGRNFRGTTSSGTGQRVTLFLPLQAVGFFEVNPETFPSRGAICAPQELAFVVSGVAAPLDVTVVGDSSCGFLGMPAWQGLGCAVSGTQKQSITIDGTAAQLKHTRSVWRVQLKRAVCGNCRSKHTSPSQTACLPDPLT